MQRGTEREDDLVARLLALGVLLEETRGAAAQPEVVARLEGAVAELNAIVRDLGTADEPPADGLRILVVDDDPDMRLLLSTYLGELGEVHCVPDVYQALGWVESERVDVMVLDILLPGASGIELLDRLRRRGHVVPTVVLSGVGGGEGLGQVAEAAGADVVMSKPVDRAALRANVIAVARPTRLSPR